MSQKSHAELFRDLFDAFAQEIDFYVINGTASEVDTVKRTCTVTPYDTGQPQVFGVKFTVNSNKSAGIKVVPADGAAVSIGFIEAAGSHFAQILNVQEFDEIVYDNGSSSVAQATKTADRLQDLEKKIDDLIQKYNTHTHTVTTVGSPTTQSGTTATPPSTESPVVNRTEESDINFSKIKIP